MAISQSVWRFQCDPNGATDPIVQVFLQKTVTDPDTGEVFTKNETTPVLMPFSQLTGGLPDLVNATKMVAAQTAQLATAQLSQGVSQSDQGVLTP